MKDLAAKSLGKISGLCACYDRATLNGRSYSRIYKDILAGRNSRFNEMMRRGGILCELGHPSQFTADFERTETDPEKAAAIITKIEEGEEGKVYAEGYILDTPAGRVYKAIAPFYKFGFSSRGSYEADEDSAEGPDGWNQDSYIFKGFDIVILPATEESEVTVSATESLTGTKKKRKSARESLDLNNIANSANVDKEELERELDKLFDENGNLAPVEYIDSREFSEQLNSDEDKVADEKGSVLLDLHKVLTEKTDLEKKVQKLLFEKAESDASLISLREQVAQLTKLKDEAERKLSIHEQANAEIQQLITKMMEAYNGYTKETDTTLNHTIQKAADAEKKAKSLAARVAELESEGKALAEEKTSLEHTLRSVKEELAATKGKLSNLRATTQQLKDRVSELEKVVSTKDAELRSAKESLASYRQSLSKAAASIASSRESLIDTYANIYSIPKESLRKAIDLKTATAAKIKSAAEQLSSEALRLAPYSQALAASGVNVKVQKRLSFGDDVEKELFSALQEEGYIGGTNND